MATNSQLDDLLERSTLVFVGTIKELQAATMATVPITENTAVVTVDEVLQAIPTLPDLTDTDITVQLRSAEELREGQQATFFTTGWLYGTSVAVQEVDHVEGRITMDRIDELAAPGRVATPQNQTARLQQRIAEADVIVVGTVSNISLPEQRPRGPITEHDPQLKVATIEVQTTEKGDVPQDNIEVVYSASDDVRWHRTPTFQVGQSGIFLLNRQEIRALETEGYAALSPLDYYPPEQIASVQRLMEPGE
jgi:hypothetical protein